MAMSLIRRKPGGLRALTEEREDAIVAAVARGVPLKTAATAAGIHSE
jgi:hypothetical protein